MKVCIAGAGIGGLTLAALLQQRGITCEIFERAENFNHAGYGLGLYPLGSRVLHGLGLFDRFRQASQPIRVYEVRNGRGDLVHSYDMAAVVGRVGYIGDIKRAELLEILLSGCRDVPMRFGTALESFEERQDDVEVRLSDGSRTTCDLLVGADGIHSATREKLSGKAPDHETGWGCWVWWADSLDLPRDTVSEYWGQGRLVGVYPTRTSLCAIGAAPMREIAPDAVDQDGATVRRAFHVLQGGAEPIVATLPDDLRPLFFWNLSDHRVKSWTTRRVALLGDAACAFLPTAGVGASMAMESAAVLADELSRTDATHLPLALELYEKRRRRRAEAIQNDSRGLAKMMFIDSFPLVWSRDQLMRHYTLEMLIKNILQSLEEPI